MPRFLSFGIYTLNPGRRWVINQDMDDFSFKMCAVLPIEPIHSFSHGQPLQTKSASFECSNLS